MHFILCFPCTLYENGININRVYLGKIARKHDRKNGHTNINVISNKNINNPNDDKFHKSTKSISFEVIYK